MRVVAVNAPWVKDRLKNISEFWGIKFSFDDYIDVQVAEIPYQALPTSTSIAVLDMEFVQKYKKGMTLFVTPYTIPVKDSRGIELKGRALASGIYLPPLSAMQRWEWFFTRLFWDSGVIQVFANENDHVYINGKDLGGSFEMWANHEFSHWLYLTVTRQNDKTHEYFYAGTPEKARDEISLILNPKPMPQPIPAPTPAPIPSPRKKLHSVAKSYLGKDASPLDSVPDEVGCADSCSRIIREVYPDFPVVTGTFEMTAQLRKSSRFKATMDLAVGNVIISPTGSGNGKIRGHVGIIGENGKIMSNSSASGLWEENFTVKKWVDFYRGVGGLRIFVFEPVS